MSVLHLVSGHAGFQQARRLASPDDFLVLLDEGCASALASAGPRFDYSRVFVLAPDLLLRGIGSQQLCEGVQVIDAPGLLGLVESHALIQSW